MCYSVSIFGQNPIVPQIFESIYSLLQLGIASPVLNIQCSEFIAIISCAGTRLLRLN